MVSIFPFVLRNVENDDISLVTCELLSRARLDTYMDWKSSSISFLGHILK